MDEFVNIMLKLLLLLVIRAGVVFLNLPIKLFSDGFPKIEQAILPIKNMAQIQTLVTLQQGVALHDLVIEIRQWGWGIFIND